MHEQPIDEFLFDWVHGCETGLLGRVILLNNFGSFIEGEKDRLRCVRALSRVLVHLNVRCGRCHRHSPHPSTRDV